MMPRVSATEGSPLSTHTMTARHTHIGCFIAIAQDQKFFFPLALIDNVLCLFFCPTISGQQSWCKMEMGRAV